jgi:hypothetical protein
VDGEARLGRRSEGVVTSSMARERWDQSPFLSGGVGDGEVVWRVRSARSSPSINKLPSAETVQRKVLRDNGESDSGRGS